jgi:hypothetical protein
MEQDVPLGIIGHPEKDEKGEPSFTNSSNEYRR